MHISGGNKLFAANKIKINKKRELLVYMCRYFGVGVTKVTATKEGGYAGTPGL